MDVNNVVAPTLIIKQEPVDTEEEALQFNPDSISSTSATKRAKPLKKIKLKKSHQKKKIKQEASNYVVKEEKVKKISKDGEIYIEPPRAEVFPDRSMDDFYCKVCRAHMNSVQVWESHIQGKRHLKNVKKEKESSVAPITVKKEKEEWKDVPDLFYIDTKGASSPCLDSVAPEKPSSPSNVRLKEKYSSDWPSPSRADTGNHERTAGYSYKDLSSREIVDYMKDLSDSILPESENDLKQMKSIISVLSQSILQYEIRQLPYAMHNLNGRQHSGESVHRGQKHLSR